MDIKELNERIEQLTELVKSGSEAIESMKVALEAAEKERDMLADQRREQELKFKRVEDGEGYWSVGSKFGAEGKATPCHHYENFNRSDNNYFDNNNYFKTVQRAEEVANKINVLLKLERLHDIYCPDYKPDWSSNETKHLIFYSHIANRCTVGRAIHSECLLPCFPTDEIAQKVCDILNKENGIKTEV